MSPAPEMPSLDIPILMASPALTHCVLAMLALEEILSADFGDQNGRKTCSLGEGGGHLREDFPPPYGTG